MANSTQSAPQTAHSVKPSTTPSLFLNPIIKHMVNFNFQEIQISFAKRSHLLLTQKLLLPIARSLPTFSQLLTFLFIILFPLHTALSIRFIPQINYFPITIPYPHLFIHKLSHSPTKFYVQFFRVSSG